MKDKWKQWLAMFLAIVMLVVLIPERFWVKQADAATPQELEQQLMEDIICTALSEVGGKGHATVWEKKDL